MPIITKKVTVKLSNNYSLPSDIDFSSLIEKPRVIDMRKQSNKFKDLLVDAEEGSLCNLPLGGYMMSLDDESSESYYPMSDWQGPSGDSWIGK